MAIQMKTALYASDRKEKMFRKNGTAFGHFHRSESSRKMFYIGANYWTLSGWHCGVLGLTLEGYQCHIYEQDPSVHVEARMSEFRHEQRKNTATTMTDASLLLSETLIFDWESLV